MVCIQDDMFINAANIFQNLLLDSSIKQIISYANGNLYFPILDLDMNKVTNYFTNCQTNMQIISLEKIIPQLNLYFNSLFSLIKDINSNHIDYSKEYELTIISNLYAYSMKSLFFVLSNPNFSLEKSIIKELLFLFRNIVDAKNLAKICAEKLIPKELESNKKNIIKNGILDSLITVNNNNGVFYRMIESCQNFLTLLLFNMGNNADEEEEISVLDDTLNSILIYFVKSFSILYKTNKKYRILPDTEFINDGLSKHLSFKKQCATYNKILNKNYTGKKPFCLITYLWLFDTAAKGDIFKEFNKMKQDSEVFNMIRNIRDWPMRIRGMPSIVSADQIFFYLKVHRNKLIEDTLNIISIPEINLRKPLKVKFIDEQGVDEGGVRKEFFLLLIRQIFDADYGMFSYRVNTRIFWFNLFTFEPKIKFELIGVIMGLSFYNGVILDVKFPLVIYKKLLDWKLSLEDMKECDPDLYNSLKYLKETKEEKIEDIVCYNFTVTVDKFGEKVVIPLKPNGEQISITSQNKDEYIDLYLDWYFNKSIEENFSSFQKGFYRVVDRNLSHLLSPKELELIICGIQELNFIELEKSAIYEDGYNKNSSTIKLFWEVLHSFDEEKKKKFLFFVTGCDRAPINGLGSLIITISRFGPDSDKLPCAHTCFNHLLLPDYNNKEKIERCLQIAINNSEGFGMI